MVCGCVKPTFYMCFFKEVSFSAENNKRFLRCIFSIFLVGESAHTILVNRKIIFSAIGFQFFFAQQYIFTLL